ncbi:hypothetical protein [Arthrobacter sp. NPDC092385]|uniref:maltokinase N-terminal cap-like domain-containing protein n=1 Tax=Arthrobacter sp. NPDC092385 TaxID=3363943 RepID=UPI003816E0DA
MALIYDVPLRPSKLELLAAWLPRQPWAHGLDGALERTGSFRFDDPDGEVGVETLLVGTGDRGDAAAGPDVTVLETPRGPVLLFRRLHPGAAIRGRSALLATGSAGTVQLAAGG